ncbi:MAG TPA: PASTA domain-containing protein [Phnomibacter sp.]|nr:PASTA domain-containing protein [Phnomibacter sp.]
MFKFITRQHFLVNLLVALLLVVGVFVGVLWLLGYITQHGNYEKVPGVVGKNLAEARQILEAKGFIVEIQDSLWHEDKKPLEVLKQAPEADAMVKAKRRLYLTINRSQPPLVDMPNLVGLSFRNALLYLQQLGLRLGDTTRKPDIARDAILEQLYNGQEIRPGTRIFVGSTVALVLGSGLGNEEMDVPVVVGMTFAEAKGVLTSYGLNVGGLVVDGGVRDTANAYVSKQYPEKTTDLGQGRIQKNKMRAGQAMDIWLTRERIIVPIDSAELNN